MIWRTVQHEALSLKDMVRIATLKDQHWTHGIDSQLRWMMGNTREGDIHLMGEEIVDGQPHLIAYMTLFRVKAKLDAAILDAIGVGCVCVDKTALGSGLGKQLVLEANRRIRDRGQPGLLLCQDRLAGFYEKCGWSLLSYETATVAGAPYDKCIMTLDPMKSPVSVQIDRNF